MRVVYVHLPRFPVQRRVVEAPSFAGRPFVLVEETRGHRRIAFASSSALKAGVRPQMTLTEGTALCPSLQAVPYVPEEEVRALRSLGEALMALGPAFQLSAPDGVWLDASAASLCGDEAGLLQRVLQLCQEHGYRGQAVVASQPFTARAVARYAGVPVRVVTAEGTREALAGLPLGALEGEVATFAAPLRALGLSSLGEVAALPPGALVARLGAGGHRVHQLCRGEDDTLLVPEPLTEVLEEALALDWPAEALEPLLFALKTTLDRLCARLAGRKRAAIRVALTLRLDPRGEHTLPLTLARPSAQPKLLLDLLKHRIADLTLQHPVCGVAVRVLEACEDRGQQLTLGEGPEGDAALEVVLARLSAALGEETLFAADVHAQHRPERAYAPRPFRLERKASGLLAELPAERARDVPRPEETHRERPSRLLDPPPRLEAVVDEGGTLRAARVLGQRREVLALAGPERLAGEWWAPEPFSRDYYRVHFDGVGPVWIYRDARDGRYYLHGMFD